MKVVTMQPTSFDPRPWNLLVGLCLASSCTDRAISVDTSGTDTTGGSESDSESTESTESTTEATSQSDGDECRTDDDCQLGEYCLNGYCYWYVEEESEGEFPSYDCDSDWNCGPLELCEFGYCSSIQAPSSCRPPDPVALVEIPAASLGLSFADVDADGAEELVIATQTDLEVYASGSNMPQVSPRGVETDGIDAMAGGSFDGTAGDDVVILFADELHQHGSDGMGNFGAPSTTASPLLDSLGIIAGEFDGEVPADLLLWAQTGARIRLGTGEDVVFGFDPLESATARSLDEEVPGFLLQSGEVLAFYDENGNEYGYSETRGGYPYAVTSLEHNGGSFDLSSSAISQWTLFEVWYPQDGDNGNYWGVFGQVTAMEGADFNGDDRGDTAMIIDGSVQIHFHTAHIIDGCLALYPFASTATGLAVGDHDGDGDDELAIRFEAGHVAIVDGE